MKGISEIHSAATENTEDSLVKCTPYISICESHNTSISEVLNSFYNILSREWREKMLMSRTEAIQRLLQTVTLIHC